MQTCRARRSAGPRCGGRLPLEGWEQAGLLEEQALTHTHTHARAHMHMHKRKHKHTRTRTRTHTYTHTSPSHTRAHTHTPGCASTSQGTVAACITMLAASLAGAYSCVAEHGALAGDVGVLAPAIAGSKAHCIGRISPCGPHLPPYFTTHTSTPHSPSHLPARLSA